MYRISQLMSTPVASSSRCDRDYAGELSPTCIFPRFTCDLLDGENSFECCSTDPLTGSHYTCRRSPRLLTNGYYIWTEDSFLCDKEGNITLNPSQTSVMYKENLVSTSESWLHGSVFSDPESGPSEDSWLEDVRRLDTYPCNQSGAESMEAPSSGHMVSQPSRGSSQDSSLQSLLKTSGHFQESTVDHSKTSLFREVFFQAIMLSLCLIISACTRWLIGEVLANVFTCILMITIAYTVTSLFLSFTSYFKTTACAQFAKI